MGALMVGRIMAKKNGYVLILGACEYIASYDKMDFADVIKLRTWPWSDSPGFSKSNIINWVLKKENLSQLWPEKCNDGKGWKDVTW